MVFAVSMLLSIVVLVIGYVVVPPIFLPGDYGQMVVERYRRIEDFLKLDTSRKRLYWMLLYITVATLSVVALTIFTSK